MKKLFLFCAAMLALSAQAEEITLNLATAVNADYAGIEYNAENIMDSTYSTDYRWSPFILPMTMLLCSVICPAEIVGEVRVGKVLLLARRILIRVISLSVLPKADFKVKVHRLS